MDWEQWEKTGLAVDASISACHRVSDIRRNPVPTPAIVLFCIVIQPSCRLHRICRLGMKMDEDEK